MSENKCRICNKDDSIGDYKESLSDFLLCSPCSKLVRKYQMYMLEDIYKTLILDITEFNKVDTLENKLKSLALQFTITHLNMAEIIGMTKAGDNI